MVPTRSSSSIVRWAATIGVVLALSAALFATSSVVAQAPAGQAHPAHIHEGACPAPGKIVFPLSDVSSAGNIQGTPMAAASPVGQANSLPVEESVTTVKASLSSLADGHHAIVIHESATNIGFYLVCGNIGGPMIGSSDLAIGLAPVNLSGFVGVASLHDNGDGTTTVYLFLTTATPSSGAATPIATPAGQAGQSAQPTTAATTQATAQPTQTAAAPSSPAAGGQAQTSVTLEMVDIAFKPNEFTIPANTNVTVTLHNTGATMHNFSITDHNNANVKNLNISVNVDPGQTKTVTINAPAGDYYYFCDVPGHEAAGMHGVMHVK